MSEMSPLNGWFKATSEPVGKYQKLQREDKELRQVSKEFEAMLVKTMVKQGFSSARKLGDDENSDHGSKQFTDMAYDQMADHLARNVGFGISDAIYESLKQRL